MEDCEFSCDGYFYMGDNMNQFERVRARKAAITGMVKASEHVTVKYLAEVLCISVNSVSGYIRDMPKIHRQDAFLYYGERL